MYSTGLLGTYISISFETMEEKKLGYIMEMVLFLYTSQ